MGENTQPDPIDEAAERFASPLRAQETLPADFEERLMSHLRREVRDRGVGRQTIGIGGWWSAPRTVSLTPLASLALAAGFAAVVAASTLLATRFSGSHPVATAVSSSDTVHVVHFVFLDSSAKRIALVGDFNGWAASATPLAARDGTGLWAASVVLRPGRHEYAFVIDGKRWAADPFALTTTDEFGTKSSIVSVGSADIKTTN